MRKQPSHSVLLFTVVWPMSAPFDPLRNLSPLPVTSLQLNTGDYLTDCDIIVSDKLLVFHFQWARNSAVHSRPKTQSNQSQSSCYLGPTAGAKYSISPVQSGKTAVGRLGEQKGNRNNPGKMLEKRLRSSEPRKKMREPCRA